MAYLAARDIQYGNPVGSYLTARDNARKNALFEQQQAQEAQAQEFAQQNTLFNQKRLQEQDQLAAQERQQASEADDRTQLFNYFSHLSRLKANPDQFNATAQKMLQTDLFRRHNITEDDVTPDQIDEVLPLFAAQAGQAPGARFEQVEGPRGSIMKRNVDTGELVQVVGPDNTEARSAASPGSYRTLTPEEVAAAGLPPGTSAQIGPDGKIDILSKRDNTGALSQKDATTARLKLNTVALARQQLQKIKEAFEGERDPKTGNIIPGTGIKGTLSAGAFGQGRIMTPAGKKFDSRVDQMRSTLTALTRVPGVGAMSDYETKLDQSKFPSRTAYESVTEDTLQNLDDQLSLIENGYKSLLSGGEMPSSNPAAPATNGPVRVNTPQEAAQLPPGTQFITPDGQVRVKR